MILSGSTWEGFSFGFNRVVACFVTLQPQRPCRREARVLEGFRPGSLLVLQEPYFEVNWKLKSLSLLSDAFRIKTGGQASEEVRWVKGRL